MGSREGSLIDRIKNNFYFQLFKSSFTLSAFTFGGGYVIVGLMKKKFVDEYKWIEENEVLDLIVLAQSSPGVIAVNSAIILGYRLRGIRGSIVALVGTVLPPLIIITLIGYIYELVIDNKWVSFFMLGMQAGVAAIIMEVVYSMVKNLIKNSGIRVAFFMFLAFVASYFFSVNIAIMILIGGTIGALNELVKRRKIK